MTVWKDRTALVQAELAAAEAGLAQLTAEAEAAHIDRATQLLQHARQVRSTGSARVARLGPAF
jgi:hypothetical protein